MRPGNLSWFNLDQFSFGSLFQKLTGQFQRRFEMNNQNNQGSKTQGKTLDNKKNVMNKTGQKTQSVQGKPGQSQHGIQGKSGFKPQGGSR